VNTSDTRAELRLDLTTTTGLGPRLRKRALDNLSGRLVDGVLAVTASEHRSQLRNREAAERRLAELLAEAIKPPPKARRPTRPTGASKERRLADKQRRSRIKELRRDRDDP
jgi:ribosome-associated protein